MFVHAFLVVASGTSLVRITRKAMARVRARAVYLHGINTLYHAVSVYTGTHKTLETLETLALRARVSKPVSAVLYIPVYTSTAWYNLYISIVILIM